MSLSEILDDLIGKALSVLSETLAVSDTTDSATHRVVEVTGWQDTNSIDSLAVYLVALRASVVDQAGGICTDLIGDTLDCAYDILRSVNEIIEQPPHSNESLQEWKSKWRNPWIAEGIWHCCMRVSMDRSELHSGGSIIALDLPHISPKDHGLDVTALYVKEDGILGMSLVETKAYRNDPNGAISDAVLMLKAIEAGEHDTRLRQIVTSFRFAIDDQYKQQLSSSLWKNERTLIPNPHYEATGTTVQWSRNRRVFLSLTAPVVVMPHAVTGYNEFFDEVASVMREKSEELASYV